MKFQQHKLSLKTSMLKYDELHYILPHSLEENIQLNLRKITCHMDVIRKLIKAHESGMDLVTLLESTLSSLRIHDIHALKLCRELIKKALSGQCLESALNTLEEKIKEL